MPSGSSEGDTMDKKIMKAFLLLAATGLIVMAGTLVIQGVAPQTLWLVKAGLMMGITGAVGFYAASLWSAISDS